MQAEITMSTIRLSVIIPFYNVEQYIARCLDSVYRQDLPEEEFEVICVDDCSPDNSFRVVKEYEQKHTNLRIVKNKENRKLGGARNAGMEVARGEYVWFIDSDDLIEANVFGTLCSTAERDNLDVLHFNYENYPVRTPLHKIDSLELMTGPEMFFSKKFLWYHDLVTAWRKLYKRSVLIENHISFAEHVMYEDNDYAILVFAKALRVRHIDLFAYDYSVNPDSITRKGYTANHISYWLDLCNRLLDLKSRLCIERADRRFQGEIDRFVRNESRLIFSEYQILPKAEKRIARRLINDKKYSSLWGYTPKSVYFKFKLGLI